MALIYFNYGYDAASRIAKIVREAGKTIYYSYDGADRLTGENWYNSGMQNVYAFAWSYDAVGNRRWQNRLGQQSYFTYDAANELNKASRSAAARRTTAMISTATARKSPRRP